MATYPIKMLRDEDRQPFIPFTNAAAVVDKDNKTLQELMDNGKYKIINNVTTTSAGKGVLDAYQGKVLKDNFNNYVPLSQKGVANGVATLDGEGKVPSAQLPSYVDDVLETYIRTGTTALAADWLSLTNGGAALTPEKGKIYLIMTAGSYQNKQYRWGGSTYVLCNPSDVNSINGMTGVVVLKDLTIQKNGTKVGDTYNGGVAKTINITVPTRTSDITNDSGFVTTNTDITGNAATATLATKAVQDQNGSVIDTTYLKKTGGDMTGTINWYLGGDGSTTKPETILLNAVGSTDGLRISYGSPDRGDEGIAKIASLDDDSAKLSLGNLVGGAYKEAISIVNGSATISGSLTGNVTGNASTATKATQDSDSNAINTTYLKKRSLIETSTANVTPREGGKTGTQSIVRIYGTTYGNDTANLKTAGKFSWGDPGPQIQFGTAATGGQQGALIYTDHEAIGAGVSLSFVSDQADAWFIAPHIKALTGFSGNLSGNATTATTADKTKAALTIQKNGTQVGSTFNGSTAQTINITVPTRLSELTNDGNYVKNTSYASATTAGVIKLGTGLAIQDGIVSVTGSATADSVEWAVVKNAPTEVSYWTNDSGYLTAANTMTGATATTAGTAGVVPAPASGAQAKYLRGDGQWATVAEATKATQDGSGNTITSTYVKKSGDTMSGRLICATGDFGTALTIERTGSTNAAAVQFKNGNGVLGYIGMKAPDGDLFRWNVAASENYKILDAGNYTTTLDTRYVKKAGDTMTGALNFANNVLNKVGDDVYIGDQNINGCLIIKGANGASGIQFNPYSGSTVQKMTIDGSGTMTITKNVKVDKVVKSVQGDIGLTDSFMLHYNTTDNCVEFNFI